MIHKIDNIDVLANLLKNNQNVVIDAWAPWCGPCKRIAPTFEKLSKKYDTKVMFVKVNVDESIEITQKFQVQSLPTFIFIKDGHFQEKLLGADIQKLMSMCKKYYD